MFLARVSKVQHYLRFRLSLLSGDVAGERLTARQLYSKRMVGALLGSTCYLGVRASPLRD